MKILLSFYPDFKITQLSDHTGTMFLSNEYDLFIDVNDNPGKWSAQRKRGTLRTDLMLRGGRVPADDVAKADALIQRYQEALVSHVIDLEEKEKEGIKTDIEVLKWHKKPRGQAQALADPAEDQEESQEEDHITYGPRIGRYQEFKSREEAAEKLKAIKKDLPEEPNLDEIQEAPADQCNSIVQIGGKEYIVHSRAGERLSNRGNDTGIEPLIVAAVDRANENLKAAFPALMEEAPADPEGEEEVHTSQPEEKGKLVFRQVFDPPLKCEAGDGLKIETDFKNQFTTKIIKNMEAANLQPGEDYGEKIDRKYKEIFDSLLREIGIAQANEPESQDRYLADRLSKIYENFEVLQLLQNCQARQDLRNLQSQEPAEEKQAREAAQFNEVFLLKNSKGYSWKITARAKDLETAAEAVLLVNESFKLVAKGG